MEIAADVARGGGYGGFGASKAAFDRGIADARAKAGLADMTHWTIHDLRGSTGFALYAAMVVMFPKLAVVGGMVNNDNLGVLATGIAIFGLVRWQGTTDRCAAALVALGMALAGWTKLTVLLMVGIALFAAEVLRLWHERAWPNMRDAAINK